MANVTLLHVDPQAAERQAVQRLFDGSETTDVVSCSSPTDAKNELSDTTVDCLVTEYDLGGTTGIELAETVREKTPDAGCILYTDADREAIESSSASPVTAYVPKSGSSSRMRLAQIVETTTTLRSQTAYPLPDSEQERLAALERYDLTDDDLNRALERVGNLARQHFDLPKAAISAITKHEQRFAVSLGEEFTPIPREETACTYTILFDDVTVIDDLGEDPRFAQNEAIGEIDITFYAGTPITVDGLPIGTLCVYDVDPREFTDDDESYLRLLGREAAAWIETLGRPDDGDGEGTS